MTGWAARRSALPFAVKTAALFAAILGALALDLAVSDRSWPAVIYVLALFFATWMRSVRVLIVAAAVSIAGIALVGYINHTGEPPFTSVIELRERIVLAVMCVIIVVIRIARGEAASAPVTTGGAFQHASEVARQVSDAASLHAAESHALAELSPAARAAFKSATDTYAEQLERRLDRLLEVLPIVVWTAKPTGEVDFFNHVMVEYTGVPIEDLKRDGWVNLIHPDDYDVVVNRWGIAVETLKPYESEFRLLSADGEFRWFQHSAKPEFDNKGRVARWWGTSVDVHDARVLEKEARQFAETREVIIQSVGDGVTEIDNDWVITFVSQRGADMVGAQPEDLVGKNLWDLYADLRGSEMEIAYRAAVETREPRTFTQFNPAFDTWFEVNARPTDRGLTVAYRDVTETRTLQANLERSQRLEAIGQLTGSIAHDFNNLLTVVLGGAEALADAEGLSAQDQELVELVLEAARQGADRTSALLAFAREAPIESRPTDVNELLAQVGPLLDRAIGPGFDIHFDLAENLPAAMIDPAQFESALLNLLLNARDAMAASGTISVETRLADIGQSYAAIDPDLAPGTYVLASVGDTGSGIAPEHVSRVFDPFFTTKPAGRGSGLGLAMVWAFARQSGGHVTLNTKPGVGTTFHLYLPTTEDLAAADANTQAAREDPPGHGTVLIAEEDHLVREFARTQLKARGYEVITAVNTEHALERLKAAPHIDLLFTAVILPGAMSGKELATAALKLRPDLRVLFASGYAAEALIQDGQLAPDDILLPKPYTARTLATAVARLLNTKEDAE